MDKYDTLERPVHPARVLATMDVNGKTYVVDPLLRELRNFVDPDDTISFDGW